MNTEIAIRLDRLHKTFGRKKRQVQAVQDLSLTVNAGQVYGFLGPNGAGKTTTIRMLLDLIRPTSGEAFVYGQSPRRQHGILTRVGAIVEGASFYPFLSGRANLEVLAKTAGEPDPARIAALLEQVGLADRAGQKVNGYSTGMKQRLGLAAALLNDPDLLILDEPTNGLDPAGIQEIRLFIRDLVDHHGKTVFLSSHILAEVEQVCDRVAIINKGHLVQEGTVDDLLSDHTHLRIEASPLDRAADLLRSQWTVDANGSWLAVQAGREDAPAIVRQLAAADIAIYQVAVQRQTLESYFLDVTRGEDTSHA